MLSIAANGAGDDFFLYSLVPDKKKITSVDNSQTTGKTSAREGIED